MAVIVDPDTDDGLRAAVCQSAQRCGASVAIRRLEDIDDLSQAFAAAEAFFILSGRSLSYTPERVAANRRGARGISWNSMTLEQVLRLAPLDYDAMERKCAAIASAFERAEKITIETLDCTLSMRGARRPAKKITGRAADPGSFSQIGGVVGFAPEERSARGTIRSGGSVKTGSPGDILQGPLGIAIEDGRITSITGERSTQICEYLDRQHDEVRLLGAVGFGLHPAARLCGSFGEDERVAGLVHLTFGTNIYHGGTIDAGGRFDFCLQPARLYIDQTKLEESLWH